MAVLETEQVQTWWGCVFYDKIDVPTRRRVSVGNRAMRSKKQGLKNYFIGGMVDF